MRQFEFGAEYIHVEDLEGSPQSKELALLPFRMTTESGYFFDPLYSFTPDLALSTFMQHDSINDEIGINARLQWIIEPGRELFVVFNHGIEPQLADLNQAPPTGNSVIVKLRWDSYW